MSLKAYIPFKWKYNLKLYLNINKVDSFFEDIVLQHDLPKAYIFLAADYGNLGDVAITFSQLEFIKKYTGYQVIEIPISRTIAGLWWVRKNIDSEDLITIVGGGNLGDMYFQIEYLRQQVIKFFPKNKIISFPQTIDFSATAKGIKYLKKAQKVYNAHPNLYMVAREKISYEDMKKYFPQTKSLLTPDIVLSQYQVSKNNIRKGAVVCLRDDQEKFITLEQQCQLLSLIERHFNGLVQNYDTHIGRDSLTSLETKEELRAIWQAFSQAEIVITDRLHGMIFCYITQTPCIVLSNNNHKIKGTLSWIKNCNYINFIEKFDIDYLGEVLNNFAEDPTEYKSLDSEFIPLINELKVN